MLRTLLFAIILCFSGAAVAETAEEFRQQLDASAFVAEQPSRLGAAIDAFYAARAYRTLWNFSDEAAQKKIEDFLTSLQEVGDFHGLELRAYRIDEMRKLVTDKNADRRQLEVMITAAMLRLGYELHGELSELDDLYTGWNFNRPDTDIVGRLQKAIAAGKLGEFYEQLTPQAPAYQFLADTLEHYRALKKNGPWHGVTPGPSLRPGDSDPRVAMLRTRLAAEGFGEPASDMTDANYFDPALEKALIAYQNRNGLSPDGHAGGKTQEALNVSLNARIEQIRANMERWRHMPDNYPPARYVQVNIPDFSVSVVDNGKTIYQGIAVVGRTDRSTPFINSAIINVMVNPSWHVPTKLARKDILPKLQRDPMYLEKQGIVIVGREEDPSGTEINWKRVSENAFGYTLRQRPGDLNSLGQLKFNFANAFDVYMHGTPHQELFDKAERAFSSGCVRLKDPERVAELVLADNKDKTPWTPERIQSEIATGKSRAVMLSHPMPVFFVYWSVFANSDGKADFRKDLYGYDAKLMLKVKNQGVKPVAP